MFEAELPRVDVSQRSSLGHARPAVSEKRLSLTNQGKVRYALKTSYRDGTTHVIFEPLEFMAHLEEQAPTRAALLLADSRAPPQSSLFG